MRKLTAVLIVLLGLLALTAVPAVAGPPMTVTVTWLEDATRYYPDGTYWASWPNDPNGPMDLLQTGKAYRAVDIGEFYNIELPDIEGFLVISGNGELSGQTTYTSLVSELPIMERFTGNVTIDPDAGTLVGTYTQYAYAFGSQEDVTSYYAVAPEKSPEAAGWWLIGYTEYTAHQ